MSASQFWFFMMGAAGMLLFQWALLVPFSRRHRVVMALLNRAKMYNQRAKMFSDAGKNEEALIAWKECKNLLAQVEELQKGDTK